MRSRLFPRLFGSAALALLLAASTAHADVVTTISGSTALTTIDLPNPNGGAALSATVTLTFSNPQNLTVACLGVSATALDGSALTALQPRLPAGGRYTVPTAFPLLLTIEPPPGCGLRFSDAYQIEIHTGNLAYQPFSEFRLLKAPVGGAFLDITSTVASGSVRTRGNGGNFSQFVVVADAQQDYLNDADHAIEDLDQDLGRSGLSLSARSAVEVEIHLARSAFDAGDYAAALGYASTIEARIRRYSGDGIPNRWRSERDEVDDEGEMLAHVLALQFQLARLNGTP